MYANKIVDESYTTGGPLSFDMLEEVLTEVLSRLPLKSLCRFKCISKQWQLMILNIVPMKKAPKLLILSHPTNNLLSFHSLNKELHLRDVHTPIEELLLRGDWVKAHSSCNGLLLIQIDADFLVWNPLTNFFLVLYHMVSLSSSNIIVDLCFDSSHDEYKVVLVEKLYDYNSNREIFFIGTCNTSRWERVVVPDTINNVSKGPFFRGQRHYLCKGQHPTSNEFDYNGFIPPLRTIVYFDSSTNKFIDIPAPQPKFDHRYLRDTFIGLGVIDECLCITPRFMSWGSNIEFLVMKEYGNGNSWSVMSVLSNLPGFVCYGAMEPLFRTKEGDVLLNMSMCYKRAGFKAYDMDRNFLKDIGQRMHVLMSYYMRTVVTIVNVFFMIILMNILCIEL